MAQSGEVSAVQIRSSERLEVIETYQKLRAAEAKLVGPDASREFAQQSFIRSCCGC